MGVMGILAILGLATQTLESVLSGNAKQGDVVAENLIKIAQAAANAYKAHTGQAIDPSQLQPIDKV